MLAPIWEPIPLPPRLPLCRCDCCVLYCCCSSPTRATTGSSKCTGAPAASTCTDRIIGTPRAKTDLRPTPGGAAAPPRSWRLTTRLERYHGGRGRPKLADSTTDWGPLPARPFHPPTPRIRSHFCSSGSRLQPRVNYLQLVSTSSPRPWLRCSSHAEARLAEADQEHLAEDGGDGEVGKRSGQEHRCAGRGALEGVRQVLFPRPLRRPSPTQSFPEPLLQHPEPADSVAPNAALETHHCHAIPGAEAENVATAFMWILLCNSESEGDDAVILPISTDEESCVDLGSPKC